MEMCLGWGEAGAGGWGNVESSYSVWTGSGLGLMRGHSPLLTAIAPSCGCERGPTCLSDADVIGFRCM